MPSWKATAFAAKARSKVGAALRGGGRAPPVTDRGASGLKGSPQVLVKPVRRAQGCVGVTQGRPRSMLTFGRIPAWPRNATEGSSTGVLGLQPPVLLKSPLGLRKYSDAHAGGHRNLGLLVAALPDEEIPKIFKQFIL